MASPLAYDRLKVSSRMSLWQPFTTLRANAVRYKWKYLVKNQLCSRQVDHTASRQQQIAVVHVTRSYAISDVANNHSLGYSYTLKRSPANCILCSSRCSLGSAVSARISATVTWRLTRLAASIVIVVSPVARTPALACSSGHVIYTVVDGMAAKLPCWTFYN